MAKGPKGEKRAADLNRRAFDIVRIASGDQTETVPRAAASKAGKSGGPARAKALTGEQRSAIAKKAAASRWAKPLK